MGQEFVSGVWELATGGGNEWAGRNLVANAPPVELLQEVARGVGMCNWVRWEAGDCKGGAGGGDSQERGRQEECAKGWWWCVGDLQVGRETRVLIRYFVWCNSFYLGTTLSVALWLKHLAQRAIHCYAFSRVRCRLSFADYLARLS